jgi:hypothetical protein
LTFLGFKNWLYRRKKVYSNYPLYGIPYIFLKAVNQFDLCREGFILADELWLICDSRLSLTSKNRFVASILSRSRKRNLNISFTTQLLDSLDKRIRKILDFSALPVLNPNETICKCNIFRTGYPKIQSYMKTFYFKTPMIFDMYDTNFEIEMEEESDQDPEIIFQETRDKSAQYFDTFEEADQAGADFWEKRQNDIKRIF